MYIRFAKFNNLSAISCCYSSHRQLLLQMETSSFVFFQTTSSKTKVFSSLSSSSFVAAFCAIQTQMSYVQAVSVRRFGRVTSKGICQILDREELLQSAIMNNQHEYDKLDFRSMMSLHGNDNLSRTQRTSKL